MAKYPVHIEGDMAWSCIDACDVKEYKLPPMRSQSFDIEVSRGMNLTGMVENLVRLDGNVRLVTIEKHKSILRQKATFEVVGTHEDLDRFRECVTSLVDNMNGE